MGKRKMINDYGEKITGNIYRSRRRKDNGKKGIEFKNWL